MRVTKKSVEEYVKTLDIDQAINYIKEKQKEINLDALLKKYTKKKQAYESSKKDFTGN